MTFRVKPIHSIAAKVAMSALGMATAAMMVGRSLPQEEPYDSRREERAQDQVLLHGVDRGEDELRLIAHDVHLPARGQLRAQLCDPLLQEIHDLDGVGAGLLADLKHHRGLARERSRRSRAPPSPSSTRATSPMRTGWPPRLAMGIERELRRRRHPAVGAERQVPRALLDLAAGELDVLTLERRDHLGGGELEPRELRSCPPPR